MRDKIIEAMQQHLQGHISKHIVNVEILLERNVGVADHPNVMDTIEGELDQIAQYHDKLEMLNKYF